MNHPDPNDAHLAFNLPPRECPCCGGRGWEVIRPNVPATRWDDGLGETDACWNCDGTGEIPGRPVGDWVRWVELEMKGVA